MRPKGENDPSIPGGLAAASPWVRLGVLFAGPVMNILVGVILAVALFYSIGERVTDKVLVRYVTEGSPSAEAGLEANDLFVSVNQQPIDSIEKLVAIIEVNLGKPIEVVVQRGDQFITTNLTPRAILPKGKVPWALD